MVALKMEDLKGCTGQLFVGETFDWWLLREASITTFNSFTIDGRVRPGYYTESEREEKQIGELSSWRVLRAFCFSLIKGKKLPLNFQITLQYPPSEVEGFLKGAGLEITAGQVQGLYMNFRYGNHMLHCITGTSMNVFLPDRQVEREWDAFVRLYLKGRNLPFTEE